MLLEIQASFCSLRSQKGGEVVHFSRRSAKNEPLPTPFARAKRAQKLPAYILNHYQKKLYKQPFSENDTIAKSNPLVKSVGVVTFLGLAGLGLAVVTSSFAVFFLSLLLTMGAILFGLIVLIVVLSKKGNKTSSIIKLLRNIALGILGFILIGRWAQRAFD